MKPFFSRPSTSRTFVLALAALATTALTGCGMSGNGSGTGTSTGTTTLNKSSVMGNVHGGNQPVTGATIQLYAAGVAGTGYGTGATALIPSGSYSAGGASGCTGLCSTLPQTDSNGDFNISGDYTCPGTVGGTPSFVYLVATGGNPGLTPSGTNTSVSNGYLAMMTAIGPCAPGQSLLTAIAATSTTPAIPAVTFVQVNEVTTVAAVWALQNFMAAPVAGNVGTPAIGAPTTGYSNGLASPTSYQSAVIGMENAFTTAKIMSDFTTGGAVGNAAYPTATPEAAKMYTLADILAYCINSDPSASSNCSALMTAATPATLPSGAAAPADTIQAAFYIAQNPTLNANNGTSGGSLFAFVAGSGAPYPNTLANSPYDWTIAINYAPLTSTSTAGITTPYGVAIDGYGNAWLSNTIGASEVGPDGSLLVAPIATYTVSTTNGAYSQFTTAPASNTATFSAPKQVAVDLNNRAWIANEGQTTGTPSASSVAVISGAINSGSSGSFGGTGTATGFYSGLTPWGLAIDGSNNVFVAQTGTAGSTELDGRSVGKFVSNSGGASDGTYTYSTSTASSPGPAPNQIPGAQASVAIDTNPDVTGGIVWTVSYNTCKSTVGTLAPSGTAVPYGLINLNSPVTVQSLADSETTTAYSGAAIGNGTASNCASSSTGVAQTFTAPMANPYGIAIDRNNGVWISDEITSSLGFDGLTYLSAATNASGQVPTSYYLVNGTLPNTTSSAATAGTTIVKPGSLAVDGNNNVWGTNTSTGSVYEAGISGTTISLLTPGQGGALGTSGGSAYGLGFTHSLGGSTGIAIDPSGNVWVTNASGTYTNLAGTTVGTNTSVTVIVGAAGPVVTPLSLAIHNNRLGNKP
jgi:hypothetical protein